MAIVSASSRCIGRLTYNQIKTDLGLPNGNKKISAMFPPYWMRVEFCGDLLYTPKSLPHLFFSLANDKISSLYL